MQMYAEYEYYLSKYHQSRPSGQIEAEEFAFYAASASARMDYLTAGRITGEMAAMEEVKSCCCAIAEALYKQDKASDNEAAAPVASWSNDGESGSYDLSASAATPEGVSRKIAQIVRTYLWRLGVLYRGCRRAE